MVTRSTQALREIQARREPVGLARALRTVRLDAGPLLGDPRRDEPEQRRPLRDRRLAHLAPALEAAAARDLVRTVRAPARVGGAKVLVPSVDPPQEPPARGDHLGPVLDDRSI